MKLSARPLGKSVQYLFKQINSLVVFSYCAMRI